MTGPDRLPVQKGSCLHYTMGLAVAVAPAADGMMQAPAAPRHELMVREDGRDWALEQMAQAAAPPSAAASAEAAAQRPAFEDISAGAPADSECSCCFPLPVLLTPTSHAGLPTTHGILAASCNLSALYSHLAFLYEADMPLLMAHTASQRGA